MAIIENEIRLVNNTALGAYLFWRYALKYRDSHSEHEASPAPLVFLILPFLFHGPTLDFLNSTRVSTGLPKFADKFISTQYRKSNLLLGIHSRALEMRELSLYTLQMAIFKSLVTLSLDEGRIIPYDESDVGSFKNPKGRINLMVKNSEKLGLWFSQHPPKDISLFLKVIF